MKFEPATPWIKDDRLWSGENSCPISDAVAAAIRIERKNYTDKVPFGVQRIFYLQSWVEVFIELDIVNVSYYDNGYTVKKGDGWTQFFEWLKEEWLN